MGEPNRRTAFVLLGLFFLGTAASAQSNDEINAAIQFNFSTPGARSLAMGGAFLGLCDDATAAYTNPAGLTNLSFGGSEVSAEVRRWRYSNVFSDRGHAFGRPTGIGVDTIEGIEAGETSGDVSGLSFLSAAYVLPRGVTVAVYRHQLADFEAEVAAQGVLVGEGASLVRVLPSRSTIDLNVVNYGLSGAYLFDRLSVGLGVSYYQLTFDSLTERFSRGPAQPTGDTARDRAPGGFFGPPDTLGDNLFNRQIQQGDDGDVGVNLGLLWTLGGSERWRVGAAYRQGPDFDVEARFVWGPRAEETGQGRNGEVNPALGGPAVFHVPDVLGLGVAWSSGRENARLTLDVDHVRYSQATTDMVNLLGRATRQDLEDFRIEDATEVHLGGEYVLPLIPAQLIATVRLGAWYDPAHSMEYVGSDPVLRARSQQGADEIHLAAGGGLVVRESFQLDAAVDFSDRVSTVSISVVKFF